MTTPVPSSLDDLAAQTAQVERERAELDRRAAELAAKTPAVIDPDGKEYETDEHGVVLLDDDGNPVAKWAHETIDLDGRTIQVRVPQPSALQAFVMATSKYSSDKVSTDMVSLFVRNHISDRSYRDLLVAMMDPEDPFTIEGFGELMRRIASLSTGRPSGPSRA